MATNLARSSSGAPGVLGLGEHPAVEVEPGQLPVEEAGLAGGRLDPLGGGVGRQQGHRRGGRRGLHRRGRRRRRPTGRTEDGRRGAVRRAGQDVRGDGQRRLGRVRGRATSKAILQPYWRQPAPSAGFAGVALGAVLLGQAEVPVEDQILPLGVAG